MNGINIQEFERIIMSYNFSTPIMPIEIKNKIKNFGSIYKLLNSLSVSLKSLCPCQENVGKHF